MKPQKKTQRTSRTRKPWETRQKESLPISECWECEQTQDYNDKEWLSGLNYLSHTHTYTCTYTHTHTRPNSVLPQFIFNYKHRKWTDLKDAPGNWRPGETRTYLYFSKQHRLEWTITEAEARRSLSWRPPWSTQCVGCQGYTERTCIKKAHYLRRKSIYVPHTCINSINRSEGAKQLLRSVTVAGKLDCSASTHLLALGISSRPCLCVLTWQRPQGVISVSLSSFQNPHLSFFPTAQFGLLPPALWRRMCHQVGSWGSMTFISVSRTALPCVVYCTVSQNIHSDISLAF